MERSGIFRSTSSQAVRLPKAVALPDSVKQVEIVPMGRARWMMPAGESWDGWFAADGVTEDFMQSRDLPAEQERDGGW